MFQVHSQKLTCEFLYEILKVAWLFLTHVLITLNEVLVTAVLDYGTVFLLIFARQEPSTHLKQNYTTTISLTISRHPCNAKFFIIYYCN